MEGGKVWFKKIFQKISAKNSLQIDKKRANCAFISDVWVFC